MPNIVEMEQIGFQESDLEAAPREEALFQDFFTEKERAYVDESLQAAPPFERGASLPFERGAPLICTGGLSSSCQNGALPTCQEAAPFPNLEAFELFSEEKTADPDKDSPSNGEEKSPPPPPEKSPEELRIEAMRKEAEELLQEAEENARIMGEKASGEAEEIKRTAYGQGFLEGQAAGFHSGKQEGKEEITQELLARYQLLFQTVDQAVNDLEAQKRAFSQSYLEDLRDLVMTVAEKVISISLKSSGKVIEGMMRDAVGTRQAKRLWANVSISRIDYQSLLENGISPEAVLEEAAEQVRLTVVEEAEAGTCLIEFPEEIIDASVSTQIANIKKMMKNIGNINTA